VHRDTIAVAVAPSAGPAEFVTELPHHLPKVRRFFERLGAAGPLRACYEAGPCGYVLQRALASWGVACAVVAPSLIPTRPGDRIKTDKRDALALATLYRAGQLTEVGVPTEQEERVRSLTRARRAFVADVHESRQRVLKFLLSRGHVFRGGCKAWTLRFHAWLAKLIPTLAALDQVVVTAHLAALEQKQALQGSLEARIEEVSKEKAYAACVARLRCLRGIDTVSALSLAAEIGDVRRFESPPRLMGYVGLNVSEHSTGASVRRGGITKAGNSHCRRLFVEAAWHYRHAPKDPSVKLRARRAGQPPEVLACARRAEERLHRRYVRLSQRMVSQKAVTAVARELVGFVWALMQGTPEALLARAR
jgi:transposase